MTTPRGQAHPAGGIALLPGREITDTLVDLLIATVHRINARAEQRVVKEFVAELKHVSGKENILFKITEASVGDPDGVAREVVFPAAGGLDTMMDLLAEYKAKGRQIAALLTARPRWPSACPTRPKLSPGP